MRYRKAKYRKIPAYFDMETNELYGTNWFYDKLIELNIWFDVNIIGVESLPIEVEIDENNNIENYK